MSVLQNSNCYLLFLACLFPVQLIAEDRNLETVREWSGSVEEERLAMISPLVITQMESFEILWKAWKGSEAVPEIDFSKSIVIAETTRGSRLNLRFQLSEDGNLKVAGLATRDLRPGFRYVLAELSAPAIRSVEGVRLESRDLSSQPSIRNTLLPYQPAESIEGTISFGGSVSLSHMASIWASEFRTIHPEVQFEIDCRGSNTLGEFFKTDELQIGAVSYSITEKMREDWQKAIGKSIEFFPVCVDELAFIVHQDCPIDSLTIEQLRMAFSPAKANDEVTWTAMGLKNDGSSNPIHLHGRDKNSGTRQHVRQIIDAVDNPLNPALKSHSSFSEIVEAVADDVAALGFCRAVNIRDSVKRLKIVTPEGNNAERDLKRTCYLVVTKPSEGDYPAAIREFLRFIYSHDGQSLLFKDGFTLLPNESIKLQRKRLGSLDEA